MMDQDIRTMHPREIVRGLMRGHAPDFKQGWPAEGAIESLRKTRPDLGERTLRELLAYAEGFAHGMVEDSDLTVPATRTRGADR